MIFFQHIGAQECTYLSSCMILIILNSKNSTPSFAIFRKNVKINFWPPKNLFTIFSFSNWGGKFWLMREIFYQLKNPTPCFFFPSSRGKLGVTRGNFPLVKTRPGEKKFPWLKSKKYENFIFLTCQGEIFPWFKKQIMSSIFSITVRRNSLM